VSCRGVQPTSLDQRDASPIETAGVGCPPAPAVEQGLECA